MTATAKPDIRELVGVAVNSSGLMQKEGHECALDRVAALGAAALAMRTGADIDRLPIAASRHCVYGDELRACDVIAAELGPILWHIRYGEQHGLVPQAIKLYAVWLRDRRLFSDVTDIAVLEVFSTRVLHEWLSDRCIACAGSGKLERSKSGAWIRPRGAMQRNAVFRVCPTCNGTRRRPPSHGERARCLSLSIADYEKNRWQQRFAAALIWLNSFHAGRVSKPLTAQLERRIKRP